MKTSLEFESIAVHGKEKSTSNTPVIFPICQTASYELGDTDNAANLFNLGKDGDIYSRINNPTLSNLESKVALLEGGVGALAVSSGQSAILTTVLTICKAGDHIISSSSLYGGTYTLFNNTLKNLGIDVTFIDQYGKEEDIKKLCKQNTKMLYCESIGNPGLDIIDIDKLGRIALDCEIALVVDNTFATPYLFKPIDHGANIVVHSATKYLSGHGNSIAGIIVDGGNFNWNNKKYPEFSKSDVTYNNINFSETFKEKAFIVKARAKVLRDVGCCLSPFNGFLVNQGIETLSLRMERHSSNADKLYNFLKEHSKVKWVKYPKYNGEDHRTYFENGYGGMLTFGILGGKVAGKRFIDNLKLALHVANVGDTRTMVIHPGSTTHGQLTEEEQRISGVDPDLIRVSVGIENIDDIISDFENALDCRGE